MAVYDYAEAFTNLLQQKYAKEMCSDALTQSNPQVKFLNAQTIKLPRMTVSGYKDHTRTPGFNSGTLSNGKISIKIRQLHFKSFVISVINTVFLRCTCVTVQA